LKLARTIADLAGEEEIATVHLTEVIRQADVNGDRLKGHSNFDAQKGGHKVNSMLEARDQNPDALV